jgi:hypothetical protein
MTLEHYIEFHQAASLYALQSGEPSIVNSLLKVFFFRFPNLFAICIHTFKYNRQIVC